MTVSGNLKDSFEGTHLKMTFETECPNEASFQKNKAETESR